jgi:predicted permease
MLWIVGERYLRITTDWRIVLACGGLGLASMFGFGLAPAFQTVKRTPASGGTRKVLVAVQVAVSCVLLIFSSFLIRGVERVYQVDVSYDTPHMAVVYPDFYLHRYMPAEAWRTAEEIAGRLRQAPGIDGAAVASIPPTGRRAAIEHMGAQQLYTNTVDAAYFKLMRLPLLEGRVFGPGDKDATVVSQSAARKLWPNESPLGKTLSLRQGTLTVAGVVKDSGASQINYPEAVEVYMPVDRASAPYVTILVHTVGKAGEAAGVLRTAVAVPDLTPRVSTFQAEIDERMESMEKLATVMTTLGGIASWLAMIGIFGLLAFTVTQRTREIGVRMALGARAADVLRCVLGQYTVPFGVGMVAGMIVATGAVKVLGTALFGAAAVDVLTYARGLVVFAAVAVLASIAPVRRALKIDAAQALRWE